LEFIEVDFVTEIVVGSKMNIFRLVGDLAHLAAIIILLLKIWKTRSCAGISGMVSLVFIIAFLSCTDP